MGLRESKKQQTRTAIADAALTLFLEHGFEQVTVAQVARQAGVSTNTVFNYFPTKEDLFFDRQADVEGHLAALVRDRAPGTCPVETVRDDLLSALRRNDPLLGLHPGAPRFWQVILDSPALRAREREISEHAETALTAALAEHPPSGEGTPDDPGHPMPALLAGALAGQPSTSSDDASCPAKLPSTPATRSPRRRYGHSTCCVPGSTLSPEPKAFRELHKLRSAGGERWFERG